ncbi:hypothetical protein AAFF_G00017550 [Aldrovandia affinis]|uniref:Bicaudal D-related protein 1 n=1 Tax=Aldrovandia affinis TaxID=143900 RepID=A0AAD7WHP8_9TELE|nr:hypothetical protein AAFF_G00017550 [Aldrovandia affinis]
MNRVKEWGFKSHRMDLLDEEFYSFHYAEELSGYQDPNELLAALKQKEEEVILAAELGNALLLENRQLKEENDTLHEQYSDKLEELEQNRHELRVKLDGTRTAWEDQVTELERDVQDLTVQTERLNQALSEAERDKTQTEQEHADETHRLREQLDTGRKNVFASILIPSPLLIPAYSASCEAMGDSVLPACVKELEQKRAVEGSGLLRGKLSSSLCPFMDGALPDLVNSSASLSRCAVSGKALEVERLLTAELQALKQGLCEQGRSGPRDEELISAMKEQVACLSQKNLSLEQRLEAVCQENAGLQDNLALLHKRLALQEEQGRQQSQQLAEAEREVEVSRGRNQQLQEQVEELQEEISMQEAGPGEASLLSELEQSLGDMGWSEDKEQVKEEVLSVLNLLLPLTDQEKTPQDSPSQQESLDSVLLLLRTVAHKLARSDTPQKLNAPIVGSVRENSNPIQELRDQISKLREENSELKIHVESRQERELTQQAIRDRDEAIAKKNAMEAELLRSKNDMMSLNNQLLEAIQRKLELSQELEAWQDDIQVILNQQLKSQQQSEQAQKNKPSTDRLAFLRRPSIPSPMPRRPSASSSSCTSERTQAPWKDWLKRGKIGQHGN